MASRNPALYITPYQLPVGNKVDFHLVATKLGDSYEIPGYFKNYMFRVLFATLDLLDWL